jgi:hypothetical protein
MDAGALVRRHGEKDAVMFYARLLLGRDPGAAWRARIEAGAAGGDRAETARRIVGLILAMPEAQLA